MKIVKGMLLLVIGLFVLPLQAQDEQQEPTLTVEQEQYLQWAESLWDSMNQITGEVELPGNVAKLTIPDSFYYLSPTDTKKVLSEVWGNPPSQSERMLGMLFPSKMTPFDGSAWGVTIEYEEDGYVSDEDADTIDYSELLGQMQQDTAEQSKERVDQGYESISLVGWASPPYYDKATNKLHWAKELKFENQDTNTLNYNIRILGRKGVLVLNFIAGIDQLPTINENLPEVLNIAEFNSGSKYQDFDPDIDDVAAYGLGALVAGKVIAKTGLIATAIILLKKFWIIILVAFGAFLRKVFSKKKAE